VFNRISGIAENLDEQLVEKIKVPFPVQADEATDSAKCAPLITYVRRGDEDKRKEDLHFWKEIREKSKAEKLFNITDSCMITSLLQWSNCVGLFTDGSCPISGIQGGLRAKNPLMLFGYIA
jgi:hypothetical protein